MAQGLLRDCLGIAQGLLRDCSWIAYGLLIKVKRAMIVCARKNADLKETSHVSFVDSNILSTLPTSEVAGPRANASGNST